MKDEKNYELLKEEELLELNGGGRYSGKGYAKTLGGAVTMGALGGAALGPGGAFVGAHFGAIGGSVKYLITGD
ncbi:Blp family class II bacteriocin [Bacillus toyonensis]|uniref:Blp family class II bacteriocin n=1 Tax=Bacillus toyonensis TaxID=155322 RepID=UPI0009A59015|nr:Blp family class II bacteriocin [Bacillus toyonensis]PGA41629.1 lactococcin A1 precursor [Bacillus toyonensis]WIG24995.1 Blp family class II bacteriocin [Bacillus toyonensis]SLK20377.1 Bacteriocin class II with double-glycine leader peptide [Bacillus toyonensis]